MTIARVPLSLVPDMTWHQSNIMRLGRLDMKLPFTYCCAFCLKKGFKYGVPRVGIELDLLHPLIYDTAVTKALVFWPVVGKGGHGGGFVC